MHAIFRLSPDRRLRPVDHSGADFFASPGGQAVEEMRLRSGPRHQRFVDPVRRQRVMPIFALITWGWIWKTRDTNLDNLDPKLEIKRYFYWLMWLGVYLFGVYWGGSFFTEQDASWHQVIIRDTSFTPSHVVVFYGSFPMYIVCGVASYLYAMTRLPLYARGTSFPLVMAIAGPLMILPNVGLNEWGHAFWFMEELFSAPLHWGFVILGWSGLFAGGIAAQVITRYSNLTDVIWNGQSKVILNNRIVP